jgi:hypothetical protein
MLAEINNIKHVVFLLLSIPTPFPTAAATIGIVWIMKLTLSLFIQNGSISNFGSWQATVKPLPSATYSSSGFFQSNTKKIRRKSLLRCGGTEAIDMATSTCGSGKDEACATYCIRSKRGFWIFDMFERECFPVGV